jgi:hypothetical protein
LSDATSSTRIDLVVVVARRYRPDDAAWRDLTHRVDDRIDGRRRNLRLELAQSGSDRREDLGDVQHATPQLNGSTQRSRTDTDGLTIAVRVAGATTDTPSSRRAR